MNLPNKLTLLRVVMIPFFMAAMAMPQAYGKYIALIIFILASLTDTADGYIARKYHLITDFGKFMDPLADKLLVTMALLCLMHINRIPYLIVAIIIAREFIISGFRLVASDNGIVIAAGIWGKLKTVCQMVMVIVLLLELPGTAAHILEQILIYASLALTVISLVDYLVRNWSVLGTER